MVFLMLGPGCLQNRAQRAVGAPAASQISLVNAFDASSAAAALDGPNVAIPAVRKVSATPAAASSTPRSVRGPPPPSTTMASVASKESGSGGGWSEGAAQASRPCPRGPSKTC